MCLLTLGSRPSSARPGKIVLRDAIGLAVDQDREDSSFYRHLEQIGKDISFGVVDNILVIWSFDWILHLSWWSRRTLNHSGGNRYQWSCDLRSNDICVYIYMCIYIYIYNYMNDMYIYIWFLLSFGWFTLFSDPFRTIPRCQPLQSLQVLALKIHRVFILLIPTLGGYPKPRCFPDVFDIHTWDGINRATIKNMVYSERNSMLQTYSKNERPINLSGSGENLPFQKKRETVESITIENGFSKIHGLRRPFQPVRKLDKKKQAGKPGSHQNSGLDFRFASLW